MDINIKHLKNGNELVFNKIIQAYWPRLKKFADIYTLDEEVSKELVQDTFLVLWNKRKELKDDTCLISFLMVVCRNKCLNYLAQKKYEISRLDELNEEYIYTKANQYVLEDSTSDILETKDLEKAIQNALEKLPAKTKEIFLMSRYDNKKNKEIAESLNISIKTVEFHINKALQILKQILTNEQFIKFIIIYYTSNNFFNH